jgi:hypothetical protein
MSKVAAIVNSTSHFLLLLVAVICLFVSICCACAPPRWSGGAVRGARWLVGPHPYIII